MALYTTVGPTVITGRQVRWREALRRTAVPCVLFALCGCGAAEFIAPSVTPGGASGAVLVGAGDIAECDQPGSEATARLLDTIDGSIFTTGDNAYFHGTASDFRDCYDSTWGRHKFRTRPTPGNHEYEQPGAAPYFAYFGGAAGPPGLGYYSYTVGTWHVISLNTEIDLRPASDQLNWLRSDLAANPAPCTIAIWHRPLFTSGPNGPFPPTRELWQALYDAGADIVINGHEHLYERFAPQDPQGRLDLVRGLRQFIAGTGGAMLYEFTGSRPNSEVRLSVWGVLKLTLTTGAYRWDFVPVAGSSLADTGAGVCH